MKQISKLFKISAPMLATVVLLLSAICTLGQMKNFSRIETNVFRTENYFGDIGLVDSYYCKWLNQRKLGIPIFEELSECNNTVAQLSAITNDLFLSIRCSNNEFLNSEPVVAIIVLRNMNSKSRCLKRYYDSTNNFLFYFYHNTNVIIWSNLKKHVKHEDFVGGQGAGYEYYELPGRSQLITFVKLNQLVDMKSPGNYSVQIRYHDLPPGGVESTNLVSNMAQFKIVKKLSPSEIAARKAQRDFEEDIARRANEWHAHGTN